MEILVFECSPPPRPSRSLLQWRRQEAEIPVIPVLNLDAEIRVRTRTQKWIQDGITSTTPLENLEVAK